MSEIEKKKPPRQNKYHYARRKKTRKNMMKMKIGLNGSFRGALKILIELFRGKSTIPDRSKQVPEAKTWFFDRFWGIFFSIFRIQNRRGQMLQFVDPQQSINKQCFGLRHLFRLIRNGRFTPEKFNQSFKSSTE